jgi:lysozyme
MRAIPDVAVKFVAKHEARRLTAYPDPASPRARTGKGSGAPWTIGYGHTSGVKVGDKITAAQALEFLAKDMETAARALEAKIGPVVDDLTENQYAALISFVFNLGTGDPKKREWSIWAMLRKRQYDQVPAEMMKFVNAGGRKLQGLVNRRAEEIKLWSTEEPGSDDVVLTSNVTRAMPTPPTPADPVPPQRSASIWAAMTAPLAGLWLAIQSWGAMILDWVGNAPDFIKQAINAVDPFAEKSPLAEAMQTGLATAGAALGIFVAWRMLQKKRADRR